ncbi:hypothetical protein F8388_019570, partial [Cannabis sativa]
ELDSMALTNFILIVASVSAVVLLLSPPPSSDEMLMHIRNWLEEESASATKAVEKRLPKELESKASKEDIPKGDKH